MKKFYFLFLFALIASISNLYAAEKTVTYTFTSKTWAATCDGVAANWTSIVPADAKYNAGPCASNPKNHPSAESPITYTNIKKIDVAWKTTSITGSIDVYVGSEKITTISCEKNKNLTTSISPTTTKSGKVKFVMTTTGANLYLKSIAITYEDGTSCGVPTFSVEEGTYKEAQAITLTPGEGGAQVFYTINGGTEQPFIEPIKLEEDGTYKIAAYTAANGALAKSTTVTKTYVISLPLDVPYILCEDAAWLTDGAKIIFVGKNLTSGETFGMTSQGTNTYRSQGGVTLSEDGNFLNDKEAEVRVFSVERSGAKMAFKDVEGYLYTNNAKNSIRTKETIADDCYWTVSIGTDNVASVVSSSLTKETDYRNIKYNASSYRFAAYNDSYEGKVYIYLLGSTSSVSSMSAEGVKVFAAEGGVEVVADEAADVAVYTVAGQLVRQARVAEGSTLVNVAPGFYVVRANGTATKVIVR